MSPLGKRERLGEYLIRHGLINQGQLKAALEHQARQGGRIGDALVALGYLTPEVLLERLAAFYGVPYVSLRLNPPDPAAARLIPARLAHRFQLIPIRRQGDRLVVAMADPADVEAEDEVRALTGLQVEAVLAGAEEIAEAAGQIFDVMQNAERAARQSQNQGPAAVPEPEPAGSPAGLGEEGPVVALVQSLLVQAVRERASDIHLEPQEVDLRVRFRVDGMLREVMRQPRSLLLSVVTRLKVMAGMDNAERRLPQDGRFGLVVDGRSYDFRVSTLPSLFGEKAVLRILDKSAGVRSLAELGFPLPDRRQIEALLARPYGLFLVVGPTGSGKSTTLSAALAHLNSVTANIVTVEDPIEYQVPGVCQVQVNPKAGLTFAAALRHILRQDPDVIMVGEIRDRETAQMAVQAALTGHLVLSTLHTGDAASAVARLLDMGIEPVLLATALTGVLAQRLVRLLCPHCREAYTLPDDVEPAPGWRLPGRRPLYRPPTKKGGAGECRFCRHGYAGRTVVAELMTMDETLRELVLRRAGTDEIRWAARTAGMRSLREDGLRRVLAGETSLEEVLRVTDALDEPALPQPIRLRERVPVGGDGDGGVFVSGA